MTISDSSWTTQKRLLSEDRGSFIRRILLGEVLILALIGGLLGIAGAILYARIIVYGLGTWWVGAVGTTMLRVHVQPLSLVLGAATQ